MLLYKEQGGSAAKSVPFWLLLVRKFFLHVSRVMTHYLFAQCGHVYVRINLRSGYVFVTEHLLDGSQTGSSLQQGGGERMAQRVGGELFARDAGSGCVLLDDEPEALPGQRLDRLNI